MRIRYKKLTRSTDLSPVDLIKNILAELDKPGYHIIKQDEKNVEFRNNIWRFGSRDEVFRIVDGGTFEINSNNKNVVFSFYISATFEAVATFVVVFIAFTQDRNILIFIIFIWIMFIVRIFSVKNAANRMIENIVQ